jgi:hypothetical protein
MLYGNATAPASLGNGSVPLVLTHELTGLAANTTFHFRVRATNAFGGAAGQNLTLVTVAGPPRLTGVRRQNQAVRLEFDSRRTDSLFLQSSTNFLQWQTRALNNLNRTNGLYQFIEADALTLPLNFYRIVEDWTP